MILWTLATRAGSVVTKDELMSTCWPGIAVGDDALSFQIGCVRTALGDGPRNPTYIETVHRLGYRFRATQAPQHDPSPDSHAARPLHERDAELATLGDALARAAAGKSHFAFITGEAGAGKTALIDRFVTDLQTRERTLIGRGCCLDLSVRSEAFLPLVEALGSLCRGAEGPAFKQLLERHAPSWLARMPSRLEPGAARDLRAWVGPSRMLRELADVLLAAGAEHDLVLVLEDLHLSDDDAVVDLLTMLANRHEAARLFVITSFRPSELVRSRERLQTVRRELKDRGRASELSPAQLSLDAVSALLRTQVPALLASDHNARLLHQRAQGDPWLTVRMIEQLVSDSASRDDSVFDAAHSLMCSLSLDMLEEIGQRLARLCANDRALLEAASGARTLIQPTQLSGLLGVDVGEVTLACERLAARGLFLQPHRWPGSSLDPPCFAFRSPLLQELVRAQIAPSRRERVRCGPHAAAQSRTRRALSRMRSARARRTL